MHWNKIGNVFDPTLLSDYGITAALMPIVDIIDDNKSLIRVYFRREIINQNHKFVFWK